MHYTTWVNIFDEMSQYIPQHEFVCIATRVPWHKLMNTTPSISISRHDLSYNNMDSSFGFCPPCNSKEREGKHEFLKTPSNYRAWTICWVFWNPARYCMMLFKLCYIFSNTLKESLKQSWILKHFSILLKVFKIIFLKAILSRFPKRL